MQRKIFELTANKQNPRTITPAKAAALKKSLMTFGDLGGLVFNRARNRLVGGHMRIESFKAAKDPKVIIEKTYAKPTKTGTVAEGFVEIDGERFSYREVDWPDEHFERAANLNANKAAGEWSLPQVATWLEQMKQADFSLELTMFDAGEQKAIAYDLPMFGNSQAQAITQSKANTIASGENTPDIQSNERARSSTELDISAFEEFSHECPRCGFHFDDSGKAKS